MKYNCKLYKRNSKGKAILWEIGVNEDAEEYWIQHGLLEGKQVHTVHTCTPKNVGRSNMTTGHEQAIVEAKARRVKQTGYSLYSQGASLKGAKQIAEELPYLPQLAHDFRKRGGAMTFPCSVQPKLDGCRAFLRYINGEVRLISRTGKDFIVPTQIRDKALQYFDGPSCKGRDVRSDIWDGELVAPRMSLQRIVASIMKPNESSHLLQFHIFDIATPSLADQPWRQRENYLVEAGRGWLSKENADKGGNCIKIVESRQCDSKQHVYEAHADYVLLGYEGVIVREYLARYKFGARNPGLQKYKEFITDEFKIKGLSKDQKGSAILECWTCPRAVKTFKTALKGSQAYRKEVYDNREALIGKMVTVQYQALTLDQVPQFPVAICIRDYD